LINSTTDINKTNENGMERKGKDSVKTIVPKFVHYAMNGLDWGLADLWSSDVSITLLSYIRHYIDVLIVEESGDNPWLLTILTATQK
jgi:hypothetical protein